MNKGKFLANFSGDFVEILRVDLPKLVPSDLWRKMDKYRNNLSGFGRYLSRYHKTSLSIDHTNRAEFFVSGEFAMDEEKMKIFAVIPSTFTDRLWDSFKFEVIITLMHEYVHFMQWKFDENEFDLVLLHKQHNDPDRQEKREYYASWSEIQAYAHCVLMEIKARNRNLPAHKALRAKRVGYYSPTLKTIKRQFDGFDYPLKYLYREVLRWEKRYEDYAKTLNITN